MGNHDRGPQPNDAAFTYYPRLRAVAQYVRTHLSDHIALEDVSQVAGLERKYFSVYFRSKVGLRYTEWLRLVRVQRAKELMDAEDVTIPRLAFSCGFRDVRTFERAFKRLAGVPPVTYRAAKRPKSSHSTEKQ